MSISGEGHLNQFPAACVPQRICRRAMRLRWARTSPIVNSSNPAMASSQNVDCEVPPLPVRPAFPVAGGFGAAGGATTVVVSVGDEVEVAVAEPGGVEAVAVADPVGVTVVEADAVSVAEPVAVAVVDGVADVVAVEVADVAT